MVIGDLVIVKMTSPKYKWHKNKIGTVQEIPTEPIRIGGQEELGGEFATPPPDIIVNFNGLECAFNKNELTKV